LICDSRSFIYLLAGIDLIRLAGFTGTDGGPAQGGGGGGGFFFIHNVLRMYCGRSLFTIGGGVYSHHATETSAIIDATTSTATMKAAIGCSTSVIDVYLPERRRIYSQHIAIANEEFPPPLEGH